MASKSTVSAVSEPPGSANRLISAARKNGRRGTQWLYSGDRPCWPPPKCNPGAVRTGIWLRCLILLLSTLFALPPGAALAEAPPEFRGTWRTQCDDPGAPRMTVTASTITLQVGGQEHRYASVEGSYSFVGGAKSAGEGPWLLTSKTLGAPYEFIAGPPIGGFLILEENNPKADRAVRALFGRKLYRCGGK